MGWTTNFNFNDEKTKQDECWVINLELWLQAVDKVFHFLSELLREMMIFWDVASVPGKCVATFLNYKPAKSLRDMVKKTDKAINSDWGEEAKGYEYDDDDELDEEDVDLPQ